MDRGRSYSNSLRVRGCVFGAIAFGGWPVFFFLVFHARRHGAAVVMALSMLTFFVGSLIATRARTIRARRSSPVECATLQIWCA